MIDIPTNQEEILKEQNMPALIRNRFGIEVVIDLYTAKRLASKNEVEIIDENFNENKTKKTTKTQEKPEEAK
ncbi:hypothetical protein BLM37_04435 [Candidatus Gracilibacteria bacterium GN02-873]|nr:hypothetical protein BLM37_04435 [Candidatus Gracilibacteria bacterium GN02-873]